MADTDVFGILSILLAAGGAAYLVRARRLARGSAEPAPSIDPPPLSVPSVPSAAPAASVPKLPKQSLPPGTARESAGKPHPDRWYRDDLAEAELRKAKEGKSEPAVPATPAAKVEVAAPLPGKTTLPSKERPEPAPITARSASTPSVSPAVPRPRSGPPSAPASGPAAPKSAHRPIVAPKASAPPAAEKATEPAASAPPKPVAAKASPKTAERGIPRLEVEDDEDVEPTKVGKLIKRREIQPPVEKHIFDEGADGDEPERTTPLLVVYALAQSDPGKRRKQNEDSYLILEDEGVFVVADGMGGHKGGQVASNLAVTALTDAFTKKNFEGAPHPGLPKTASELARAIQMANATILEEATQHSELKGMGTTMCAVRFSPNKERLYIGHVGDSRCYRVRGGVMKQITTDHTMADYGVSGPEGAHLSRALGVWPTVPIDVIFVTPQIGDLYLMCSDGLTKMLPDGTISTQLLHEDNPKAAVERLVFFANAHGGKDNITVILLRMVEPGWKPPSDDERKTSG